MANDKLSIVELTRMQDGATGKFYKMVNKLRQENATLRYGSWLPTNMLMTNVTSIIVGEPNVYTRRFNKGTVSSKATFDTIVDTTALIEAYATTDATMLRVFGNAMGIRDRHNRAYQSAMGKKVAELQFYGNETDDETEFNGLFTRPSMSDIGDYCLDAGGTDSDLGSICAVTFSEDTCHWAYPRNTTAGLFHDDMGKILIQEAATMGGGKISCFVDQWQWFCGLVLCDDQYAGRIANIDVSDMKANTGAQESTDYTTYVLYLLDELISRIPNPQAGQTVLFMPRAIKSGLNRMAKIKSIPNIFKMEDAFGRVLDHYQGYPMEIVDQMTITETQVT